MRIYDIIKNKRDGLELTTQEINYFISGYTNGEIADYQAAALCMAIYFNGMSIRETADLTFAMRDSGEKADFSAVQGIRVDQHSTGGVGDKTSLIITPIVASYGIKVAKMSGRGLGHTGGTIDKLESIKGFKTSMTQKEFIDVVNNTGIAIVGQSNDLAPADKKLYALRDVTATVDSLPLIASSIMSKKLAADDDCIVLDVKTGSGSFMKTLEDSKKLAQIMVDIGKKAGKKILALITDMDKPLGRAIGNSLEVIEAVETLKGQGPKDLTDICITLASNMLYLAGKGTLKECEQMALDSIKTGSALNKLIEMVDAQGGDVSYIKDTDNFPKAKYCRQVLSPKDGYITSVDTEGYGVASLMLGAGRNRKEDEIDYTAGIILLAKTDDCIKKDHPLAIFYANNQELFDSAEQRFLQATVISDTKIEDRPIVLDRIE